MRILRTYIYIDGLNLYYRALRHTPYKWLDLLAFCERVLHPQNRILKIKYFTARLQSTARNPLQSRQQDVYFRALRESYPKQIEIHLGRFLAKPAKFPLADPAENGRIVSVIRSEEKGSDVNLAVHMVSDAWEDLYDCAVLISNDSDFAEAMRLTKEKHPQKLVGLISPVKRSHSVQLYRQADFFARVRASFLRDSQLPDPIPGTNLHKPAGW